MLVLITAGAALARWPHHANPGGRSAGVDIDSTSMVAGGPTLEKGHYKVVLNTGPSSTELDFYRDGSLVAKSPVTVVPQSKKIGVTEVQYDNPKQGTPIITEIDFRGWKETLKFREPATSAHLTN